MEVEILEQLQSALVIEANNYIHHNRLKNGIIDKLVFFWRFQGQEGVRCALCTNAPYATVMTVFLSIGHVHIHLYIYKMG